MKLLRIVIFLSLSSPVLGQINNNPFENRLILEPADSNKLFLGLSFLGFGKNNEYFDTVIDGYTLFGYQINPYLSYQLSKSVRFDIGAYFQKDFGNHDYASIEPTLSLKVKREAFNFIFGTLEGSLNHRLIEPLYNFESVLNHRLENGIQVQWIKEGLFLDTWVDWQNMIYFNDPEQEKFVAGLSLNKRIFKWGNNTVEFPLQLLISHEGGQIDNNPESVKERLNATIGLDLGHQSSGLIKEWGIKSYAVFYQNRSSESSQVFKEGTGLYINPYIITRFGLTVMASYWKGSKFLSSEGNTLFTSANDRYLDKIDPSREVYMLRFLYDINVVEDLNFSLRFEPLYDTFSSSVQYSYGFYLNFYNRFFLLHAKKNR